MRPSFFEQFPTMRDLSDYLATHPETAGTTATKFIATNLPKESAFQRDIIRAVRQWVEEKSISPSMFLWKHTAGVYQSNGLPDLMMVCDGRFFAFEVKRPYVGRQTTLQVKTIESINAAGGHAAIVSYPSEVRTLLQAAGVWKGAEK